MLSWKNLCLGAALAASPLLMAGEARGEHYRHGHSRPGCDVGRYGPSYRSGYQRGFHTGYHSSFGSSHRYGAGYGSGIGIGYRSGYGIGYTPRVYARPPIPFGVPGGAYRYGAGYPRYGTSGFSLYIGR